MLLCVVQYSTYALIVTSYLWLLYNLESLGRSWSLAAGTSSHSATTVLRPSHTVFKMVKCCFKINLFKYNFSSQFISSWE